MQYSYRPRGVCSQRIDFEIEDNKIKDIRFYGGCDGNLQAISTLVKGMDVNDIKAKLKGIRCGMRSTSCSDQLVQALEAAMIEEARHKTE